MSTQIFDFGGRWGYKIEKSSKRALLGKNLRDQRSVDSADH